MSSLICELPDKAVLPIERGQLADRPAPKRTWLSRGRKVALLTALFFIGLEIFTRTFLFSASKDFSRFQTYPGRVKALVQQPGLRIACIGNSLTERGVDERLLAETLSAQLGRPAAADVFTADASKICTWRYMLNRYFWSADCRPDVIVIPFYEHNLSDNNRLEIGRFAQFFVTLRDWPEVLQHDVTSGTDRVEFVVSSFWATYAARARTQERVLSMLIPNYQDFTNWTHEPLPPVASAPTAPVAALTHSTLRRLIDRARMHGSKVVFVAFPTLGPDHQKADTPYAINPEARQIIADAEMELIDLRRIPELTVEMYADDIHLNGTGEAVFTRILADELAKRLGDR